LLDRACRGLVICGSIDDGLPVLGQRFVADLGGSFLVSFSGKEGEPFRELGRALRRRGIQEYDQKDENEKASVSA
jgi:hypothetical protein